MSRSRAATPAGKRRASSRGGSPAPAAGRKAAKRTAPKRVAPKRTAPKRAAPKRAAPKRAAKRASPKRASKAAATRGAARRPATPRRAKRRPARRAFARPRPIRALRTGIGGASWRYRLAILAILAISLGAGYMFWLRDSSLVAINNVDVVGVASGDREQIVSELTKAAEQQTTLHTDSAKIERLAAGFPTIASVSIDTNFPHGMRIEVTERPPAMIIEAGDQQLAAAGDGSLLAGDSVADQDQLPVLEVDQLPTGTVLEGNMLAEAQVLGAVPPPLRPLIDKVGHSGDYGVEVTLDGDIPVRFGNGLRAAQKWAAAAAVMADPDLTSLTYVDVRLPERPTVGGQSADPIDPAA